MTIKSNEIPAFPADWDYIGSNRAAANGMTLRDYFAAKAMPALIQGMSGVHGGTTFGSTEKGAKNCELAAVVSYAMADAMLKARKE